VAIRPRVLIRSAAGPRLGYGHLVRARTLSSVLDADVHVSLRGGPAARAAARRMRLVLAPPAPAAALAEVRPAILVIDDPNVVQARRALAAARAAGVPAASIHDLGLAPVQSDLVIDGSIRPPTVTGTSACLGPRYAILDPQLGSASRQPASRACAGRPRVLVALGGGPRVALGAAIARAVVAGIPGAEVRVAAGLARRTPRSTTSITWLGPLPTLVPELAACDIAIVAGGVTLYEACALGARIVALPIVPGQAPAVEAFAGEDAILAVPNAVNATSRVACAVATEVRRVMQDRASSARRCAMARRLVDGRGASRVAAALLALARRGFAAGGVPCAR